MATRDPVAGPEAGPEPPFPIHLSGPIIKGFGRGSRELGIPTANIPISGLDIGGHTDIESGVYFGYVGLCRETAAPHKSVSSNLKETAAHIADKALDTLVGSSSDSTSAHTHKSPDGRTVEIYPMVASIGWNPFYKNTTRSVEIHIIHAFDSDFYNSLLNVSVLGFIRKERDYDGLQALIDDIKIDIEVAGQSLARKAYAAEANDKFLLDFGWAASP